MPGLEPRAVLDALPLPPTGINIDLTLTATCTRCGAAREVDRGRTLLEGERTLVVELAEPCHCGEKRVMVKVGFDST